MRASLVLSLAFSSAALAACSLIVTGDVPEVRCSGTGAGICPSGLVCNSATSTCVNPTAIGEDGGDPGPGNQNQDGGPTAGNLGARCGDNSDCERDLLCGSSTMLTSAVTSNSNKVCTKACCSSEDCGSGYVCLPAGTGGNYCVAAQKISRTPPPSGGKRGGDTCTAPRDCRSGLCTAGRCVDACCDDSRCVDGTICRIADVAGHKDWVCGLPVDDAAEVPALCGPVAPHKCKNNNCVAPFSKDLRCTPPCCSANDCAAQGLTGNVCRYGSSDQSRLKWCAEPNPSGKPVGEACANDDLNCASRYCDPELNVCLNVCCRSEDCGAGEECLPAAGSLAFLRCVKSR